ncbi:MAG: hypothetical protein HYR76_07090 [Ignavibacteria bacterium]|nr:hypothetical protein [Ignavibacteria bacterium]MBI3766330.1 hypothetical protein [Ignavibacteriales bacterium]
MNETVVKSRGVAQFENLTLHKTSCIFTHQRNPFDVTTITRLNIAHITGELGDVYYLICATHCYTSIDTRRSLNLFPDIDWNAVVEFFKAFGYEKGLFTVFFFGAHFWIYRLYMERLKDRQKQIDLIAKENHEYREKFMALLDKHLGK